MEEGTGVGLSIVGNGTFRGEDFTCHCVEKGTIRTPETSMESFRKPGNRVDEIGKEVRGGR